MAFLIIAGVILVINVIFLIGSIIYTMKVSKGKAEPRLSSLGSVLDHRKSLQPQIMIYEAIVRMSGNPTLDSQITEKTDNGNGKPRLNSRSLDICP